MNIYIYGNQSFKKEIHQTLEHANIRFKLDENTLIKEIENINELKETIKNNPKDIYLIDDSKIIKKKSLNKKLKFLAPKDGIDEEFLLDSGIADLSIDSLAEIPKYILKKYEEEKESEPEIIKSESIDEVEEIELDDELSSLLVKEEIPENNVNEVPREESLEDVFGSNSQQDVNLDSIESLIGSLHEDDEINDSVQEVENLNDIFDQDFGLSNTSLDYDDNETLNKEEEDFFSSFLVEDKTEEFDESETVEEEFEDIDFLEELFSNNEKKKEEKTQSKDIITEDESLENFDFNFDNNLEKEENFFEEIKDNQNEEKIETYEQPKGDIMINDDFSELDSLNEKDLLEALNGIGGENTNLMLKNDKNSYPDLSKNTSSIEISSGSNVNDLAQLLSTLLSNKTLEITIKIKD